MKHPEGRRPLRPSAESSIDGVIFGVAKFGNNVILLLLNRVGNLSIGDAVSVVFVDLNHRQVVVVDAKGLSAQNDSSFVFVFAVSSVGGPFGLVGPELPIGRTQNAVGGRSEFAETLI